MKIENKQKKWMVHFTYHQDVSVEGCKFCHVKKDNHHNESKRSTKQFKCKTCNRVLAWSQLHHTSSGKTDECVMCYWHTPPVSLQ